MKKIFLLFCLLSVISCSQKQETDDSGYLEWGRNEFYDDFLWKKFVPDTLKRTICFDFNEDSKNHIVTPLKLAFYHKSSSGKLVKVSAKEMRLFVNGKELPNNIIEVPVSASEIELGILLDKNLKNKEHHCYLKIIDTAGLNRINGEDAHNFCGDEDVLQEITLVKKHVSNPLATSCLTISILLLILLITWLIFFKPIFYPSFKVGRLSLEGPAPFSSTINLKRCRKLILCSKPKDQSLVKRIFTGKVVFMVNPLWTSEVQFEPKDRNNIRIRPGKDFFIESRILSKNQEYFLENLETKAKTKLIIF